MQEEWLAFLTFEIVIDMEFSSWIMEVKSDPCHVLVVSEIPEMNQEAFPR